MAFADGARASTSGPACLCVLGCRSGSAALARRARAASAAFAERSAPLLVACGGVAWGGRVEADEIARMLREGGVPEEAIVRERASRDTRENALFAARILRARGHSTVTIVTCSWHLPRATRLFEAAGLHVISGIGVPPPDAGMLRRAYWFARERVAELRR